MTQTMMRALPDFPVKRTKEKEEEKEGETEGRESVKTQKRILNAPPLSAVNTHLVLDQLLLTISDPEVAISVYSDISSLEPLILSDALFVDLWQVQVSLLPINDSWSSQPKFTRYSVLSLLMTDVLPVIIDQSSFNSRDESSTTSFVLAIFSVLGVGGSWTGFSQSVSC